QKEQAVLAPPKHQANTHRDPKNRGGRLKLTFFEVKTISYKSSGSTQKQSHPDRAESYNKNFRRFIRSRHTSLIGRPLFSFITFDHSVVVYVLLKRGESRFAAGSFQPCALSSQMAFSKVSKQNWNPPFSNLPGITRRLFRTSSVSVR